MILFQRDSLQRMLDATSMPSTGRSDFLFPFFFNFNTRRISYSKPVTEKEGGLKDNILLFDHVNCSVLTSLYHMWHCSPQEPLLWEQFELLNPFTLSVPSSRVGENGDGVYRWTALQNHLRCIILHWEQENQYTLVEWNLDFSKRSGVLL